MLHGLILRENVEDDAIPKDEEDMIKNNVGKVYSKYLLAAPREDKDKKVDLVFAANKFVEQNQAGLLAVVNHAGAYPARQLNVVTLIPGSNWNQIGGKAYDATAKEAKHGVEENLFRVSPPLAFVMNAAANKWLRAMVVDSLMW